MKVVINTDWGGFHPSDKAMARYKELGGKERWYFDIPRNDPFLVQAVEELGEEADGPSSTLAIVEVPDGIEWEISEYDGIEEVEEKHRSWS